jgi:hypothetical protein
VHDVFHHHDGTTKFYPPIKRTVGQGDFNNVFVTREFVDFGERNLVRLRYVCFFLKVYKDDFMMDGVVVDYCTGGGGVL